MLREENTVEQRVASRTHCNRFHRMRCQQPMEPVAEPGESATTTMRSPDLNSLLFRLVQLVTGLDVKGFVELIQIRHRAVGSVSRR